MPCTDYPKGHKLHCRMWVGSIAGDTTLLTCNNIMNIYIHTFIGKARRTLTNFLGLNRDGMSGKRSQYVTGCDVNGLHYDVDETWGGTSCDDPLCECTEKGYASCHVSKACKRDTLMGKRSQYVNGCDGENGVHYGVGEKWGGATCDDPLCDCTEKGYISCYQSRTCKYIVFVLLRIRIGPLHFTLL